MKTIPSNTSIRLVAAFALTAGGVSGLFATPEAAPSTPEEVVEYIKMDIDTDPMMKGANLKIALRDGIAMIEGTAITLDQSERATARAMASAKIRAVVNAVQIATVEGTPADLKQQVEQAFKKQDLIDASQVKFTEGAGRVVLTGTVGTWDEQELAREIVSRVPAVRSIDNKLQVSFEGIRTDQQIQAQVKQIIADDPLYTGLDIAVTVKDGVVGLSGNVGDQSEADRLVRRSYVTGVIEVNSANVSMSSEMVMEGLSDKHYTPEQILGALKDALVMDPRVDPSKIRSTFNEGVLTLAGAVSDFNEKDAAESTARGVPGVFTVSNQLEVRMARDVARNERN